MQLILQMTPSHLKNQVPNFGCKHSIYSMWAKSFVSFLALYHSPNGISKHIALQSLPSLCTISQGKQRHFILISQTMTIFLYPLNLSLKLTRLQIKISNTTYICVCRVSFLHRRYVVNKTLINRGV